MVVSREEFEKLRLVRQNETLVKMDASYSGAERQKEVLPPQYEEQVCRVGSDDCGEDNNQAVRIVVDNVTTTKMKRMTKVRFLGVPVVEMTRESQWVDETGVPVERDTRRRSCA